MLTFDSHAIFEVLAKHRVDFIVVGNVAAVLHGVPVNTFDTDVVHSRQSDNIQRALAALRELDARYRLRKDEKLSPNESHLESPGHQLLTTRFGDLDFLGMVGNKLTYEDLLPYSTIIEIGASLRVRTVNLEKLIELKEHAGRDKDLAALPTLRATLAEKKRLGK
jgi:hypothetical protein